MFQNKKIITIFLFIFLAELFSIFSYLLPDFRQIIFLAIVFIFLILTIHKLEYGLLILLAELFIGSKGYLFYFEYGGTVISIRIAFWLIIMAVWLVMAMDKYIKNSRTNFKLADFYPFVILFIFIIWGLANGFINYNEFNNIFFDFNGWLYFTLIFPFLNVIKEQQNIVNIFQILAASILWLSFKTFFILFAFSHNLIGLISELYYWVRDTGVGEITKMQGGFYRIFFQSQIFVLIGLFWLLFYIINYVKNKKSFLKDKIFYGLFFIFCLFQSVILISFSRSFWLGLASGFFISCFIIAWQYGFKKMLMAACLLFVSGVISTGLIVGIVKFPYPDALGGFSTTELLSERASKFTGEAAVSSRWNLLPILWEKIISAPFMGHGFGATVTYKSSDPRIIDTTVDGDYTTYAFEWGWLDIWLKLGILGFLFYIILIFDIIYRGIKILKNNNSDWIVAGTIIGLAVIAAVNIFSPYLNHPLGIGYLMLGYIIIYLRRKKFA